MVFGDRIKQMPLFFVQEQLSGALQMSATTKPPCKGNWNRQRWVRLSNGLKYVCVFKRLLLEMGLSIACLTRISWEHSLVDESSGENHKSTAAAAVYFLMIFDRDVWSSVLFTLTITFIEREQIKNNNFNRWQWRFCLTSTPYLLLDLANHLLSAGTKGCPCSSQKILFVLSVGDTAAWLHLSYVTEEIYNIIFKVRSTWWICLSVVTKMITTC